MKPGLSITNHGDIQKIIESLTKAAEVEVLVGFPAETADRQDDDSGITNAALAYIHDNGAPEQKIPARPFMRPAINSMEGPLARDLSKGLQAALDGDQAGLEGAMHAAGLRAVSAIKREINRGVPPPLADRTLRARARRGRKGAQKELDARANGEAPGTKHAKPLIDTGAMRNSANYAIRSKKDRT